MIKITINRSDYTGNLKKLIDSKKNSSGLDNYTQGETKYIINKITNMLRKYQYDCPDNFRFSDDTEKENERYCKKRKEGCCGFFDEIIKLKSGKIFKFGFNYGH